MTARHRNGGFTSVESLEARLLFAAAIPVPLIIKETPQADGSTQLEVFNGLRKGAITVTQTPAGLVVGNTGGWSQAMPGNFSSILIYAGAGQDSVTVDASVTTDCIIHGGRNDTLHGGSGNDSIYAGPGKSGWPAARRQHSHPPTTRSALVRI